jgi:hypothetical protein
MAVLTPAYGRDYSSQEAIIKDFEAGKDFIFHDPSSRYDGKFCSIRDFDNGKIVELRYAKQGLQTTKGVSYRIGGGNHE